MRKVILFVLTVFVFMSPVFSGTGRNVGQELLLNNDGTSISLSFEKYKMKDGWTPVVLSMGERDCLLWMDEDGRVSELRETGAQFVKPVCVIDIPTHCLRKDGATLYFDVYEQNKVRTRWRLSPRTTEGTVGTVGTVGTAAKNRTCAIKPAGTASSAIPNLERAALIALYNSTGGDNWLNKSGWKTPPLAADGFALPGMENTWYGITCDPGNTAVQMINPDNNHMIGTLPPELGNLANLTSLDLNHNQLSGSIPKELGNLANLKYLVLGSNQLSGSIPKELGNLANLEHLGLYSNQLSGSIPPELGNMANLKVLSLNFNQLSGSIPPELGNLANLDFLEVGYNQLSGSIPPELGNLANLLGLELTGNQLSGNIPKELGNLANLKYLTLGSNQFSGNIPPELGNLANLEHLWLYSNQLSGTIPPELGNLANLQWLSLYFNQLSGSIPPELGNLEKLQSLLLNSNQFSGSIPSELGNLDILIELFLDQNQLSGSIPSNLTNLTWLFSLDLRWNALYTNDDMLRAFLNSKQEGGDWESTQTIAPTNVAAFAVSTTSIAVNWTPIAYTSDTGGYRVFYSTVHGGPYTFFGMTADKTVNSLTVTGLNPGVTYYFTIKTRTNPHTNNLNKVLSRYSAEASTLLSRLVLTTPNGGESWGLRTVQNITWSWSGLSGNLRIELWKANKRFCVIASNIPITNGSYTWTIGKNSLVPIPAGTDYRVKIITANGLYNDVSNGNFSIVK